MTDDATDRENAGRDNAVLYHHPDAVDTSRDKLMGRHVAGEGFLHGLVRHSEVDGFYCHTLDETHARDFAQRVAEIDGLKRTCTTVGLSAIGDLPGTPEPSLCPSRGSRPTPGGGGSSVPNPTVFAASTTRSPRPTRWRDLVRY